MQRRYSPLLMLLHALVVALVAAGASTAQAATTFGPRQYVRAAGPPQTFTETFPRCAGPPCQLVVVNGNADGSARASVATVSLNGQRLLGPSDFNPQIDKIVLPVALVDTDQIQIVLASAPGSFLTVSVECASSAELRFGDATGVTSSIWDDGTVSLAIPLENQGDAPATNVTITGMSAGGGTYAGPTPLPYPAGTIDPDEVQHLSALFSSLDGHSPFSLTIQGTYGFGGAICPFQTQTPVSPPPAGNGGTPKSTTTVPRLTPGTAVYPPVPLPHPPDDEPNGEGDIVPPLGEPRNLFPAPPGASSLDDVRGFQPSSQPPQSGDPNAVLFFRNQNGGSYGGLPPDPSAAGATPSGFVMTSANTAVSYSTDFGATFTTVNLIGTAGFRDPTNPGRPDFFPQSDGGLCCDQVMHYVPGRDLVVWLLQYWSPSINVGGLAQKGQNRLRIAWATPQAAAADFLHAWSWFDVSPTTLGDTTATDWMDYPDLAYSNDWLYISVDHGFWNPGKDAKGNVIGQKIYGDRRWFVRASLNDMAARAPSINLVYYEAIKSGLAKAHFVQSAPDTMYFAAQPDTSKLGVFADPDASPDIPTPKDIGVTSYCKATSTSPCDFTVTAPDGLDWNVAPHQVLGGAYVAPSRLCPPEGCTGPSRFVYFAFDAGRDAGNNRAYPYIRVEKIDADAVELVSELDIWNPGFAFATPGLTARPGLGRDEVAISLAIGGGGRYADNAVGFLGEFVVYLTTQSNATQSNPTPTVRYGDYFHARNATTPLIPGAGQGFGYSTLGYSVTQAVAGNSCAASGCNVALQYVLFGHDGDLFPSPPPIIK